MFTLTSICIIPQRTQVTLSRPMKPVDGAGVSAFILARAIIHFGQHRFDSVWQELTVNHSAGKIVKLAACFGFALG